MEAISSIFRQFIYQGKKEMKYLVVVTISIVIAITKCITGPLAIKLTNLIAGCQAAISYDYFESNQYRLETHLLDLQR